jgi:RNA polymerase sigma-70 factor, ECF subfamily
MAPDFVNLALWHFVAFAIAIVVREGRAFAPKRLTAAELGVQLKLVRELVLYALRGTPVAEADVEDLTQDVMLSAWETSENDRYRPDPAAPPERALQGWLWGITHHHVTHFRDSARLWREVLCSEPPERPDIAPAAESILEDEQDRMEMLAAMQDLPPGQRYVVVAHDLDEEAMAEIAERLGVPLSTLYKWRTRGLAALKKLLRPVPG